MEADSCWPDIEVEHLFPRVTMDWARFQPGHDQVVITQYQQSFNQRTGLLAGGHQQRGLGRYRSDTLIALRASTTKRVIFCVWFAVLRSSTCKPYSAPPASLPSAATVGSSPATFPSPPRCFRCTQFSSSDNGSGTGCTAGTAAGGCRPFRSCSGPLNRRPARSDR